MYQTLYRKYRPKTFDSIVGQDIIVKVLKNSIKNNKISHAYMFIGPRGTGKTSTAKIFARAVNCENNNNGDLCEKCTKCNYSSNNECLDIIEIDAASNNGVDEIRDLRDKVNLVPSELKYKIYIIDEVHMLTIQAFNALLKTLEEPPEHIIFILATTDPQKVPETIISRCQCFNFCRISEENIVKNLKMISNKENISVEDDVLKKIAQISDGGMRDSIGMLDKLSSYSDDKITLDDFIKLNGLVNNNDLDILTTKILNGNIPETIDILEKWNSMGNNIIQILIQYLNYLKEKVINDYINNEINEKTITCQKLANLLNEKIIDLKKSSNPRIYSEIMLLNFISENNKKIISQEIISNNNDENLSNNKQVDTLKKENDESKIIKKSTKKVENEETKEKIITQTVDKVEQYESNINEIMNIRVNNTFVGATKSKLNEIQKSFKKLEDYTFDLQIGYLVNTLLDGNIRLTNGENVVLSYEYSSSVIENLENISKMEQILKEKCDLNLKIAIITNSKWEEYTKEYINRKKNNIKYEKIEEPKLMFEKNKKKEEKNNKSGILDDFSDILEVD